MTFDEFDNTSWTYNMRAEYNGNIYDIKATNFVEQLVAIDDGSGNPMWVRCENITVLGETK